MKRVLPLEFRAQGGILFPADPHLHKLASEFCAAELSGEINFAAYQRIYVAAEMDDEGKPQRVTGIIEWTPRWDSSVVRFVDKESGEKLVERSRAFLEDQGARGFEVFIHIADREPKERRCPRWKSFLKAIQARKASRWIAKV